MKSTWADNTLFPCIYLICLLALAFGIEKLNEALLQRNAVTFSVTYVVFWAQFLGKILVIGAILLVFWLMQIQRRRTAWVGLVYMVVGLYFSAFIILYYAGLTPDRFWNGVPLLVFSIESPFYWACSGIFVIGLLSLLTPGKRKNQIKEENNGADERLS